MSRQFTGPEDFIEYLLDAPAERQLDADELERAIAGFMPLTYSMGFKRRLLREALERRRTAVGVTEDPDSPIARLRRALATWTGEWPPTQDAIARAVGWQDARSVRQACKNARTQWDEVLAEARSGIRD